MVCYYVWAMVVQVLHPPFKRLKKPYYCISTRRSRQLIQASKHLFSLVRILICTTIAQLTVRMNMQLGNAVFTQAAADDHFSDHDLFVIGMEIDHMSALTRQIRAYLTVRMKTCKMTRQYYCTYEHSIIYFYSN